MFPPCSRNAPIQTDTCLSLSITFHVWTVTPEARPRPARVGLSVCVWHAGLLFLNRCRCTSLAFSANDVCWIVMRLPTCRTCGVLPARRLSQSHHVRYSSPRIAPNDAMCHGDAHCDVQLRVVSDHFHSRPPCRSCVSLTVHTPRAIVLLCVDVFGFVIVVFVWPDLVHSFLTILPSHGLACAFTYSLNVVV